MIDFLKIFFSFKYLVFLLFFCYIFFGDISSEILIKIFKISNIKEKALKNIFNYHVKNNTILIYEPSPFHYECTPGFAKYFIDLGFNVDIIMDKMGISSFSQFESLSQQIKLFIYKDRKEALNYGYNLYLLSQKYNHVLIETTEPIKEKIYNNKSFLNNNNSMFVFHHIDFIEKMNFSEYIKQDRIWSLGNFSVGLQVNPHYFGNFEPKDKNKITRFFITSTRNRSYELMISASERLKKENLDFQVFVVGKYEIFSPNNISKELQENFIFRYNVSYIDLYKIVDSSDFIIVNLDPNNKKDEEFSNIRVTGSAQLIYGFSKPAIINQKFANIYNFTKNNSLIYENSNFFQIMKDAIFLNNADYDKLKNNLIKLSKVIYNKSINNIKKSLKIF